MSAYAADVEPVRTTVASELRTAVVTTPQHSISVFAGRLSTTPLGRSLRFNLGEEGRSYDNHIVGAAYRRDLSYWGPLTFGVEVGIADRFGKYKVCCETVVRSSMTHTGELWGGVVARHEGFLLFGKVRLSNSIIAGLSATTKSIGAERQREITHDGNARLLFYLATEYTLSYVTRPELELVMRLHHRSGAEFTLGKMGEGYNAWVFGARYRF